MIGVPIRNARIARYARFVVLVSIAIALGCGDKNGLSPKHVPRFDTPRIVYDEGGYPYTPHIAVYNPATGLVDTLPIAGANGPYLPSISPDGTRIAFSRTQGSTMRGKQLVTVAIDGSDLRVCTADSGCHDERARWSPDSKRIAFTRLDFSTGHDVFIVNADGTGLFNLTQHGMSEVLDWSPDGSSILLQRSDSGSTRVGTIPASGGAFHPILDEQVSDADYSPDGTRIVAIHTFPANRLYVMSSDGGNIQTLVDTTQVGYSFSCSWYPDGNSIAFIANGSPLSNGRRLMMFRFGQTDPEPVFPTDAISCEHVDCGPKP